MKRDVLTKPCRHCQKKFSAPRGGNFCSPKCRTAYSRANKPKRDMSAIMADRLQTKKSNGEMVRCNGVTSDLARCSSDVWVNGTNRPGGKKNRQRYCGDSCRQRSSRLRRKHSVATNQQLYGGAAVLA